MIDETLPILGTKGGGAGSFQVVFCDDSDFVVPEKSQKIKKKDGKNLEAMHHPHPHPPPIQRKRII